MSSNILKERQLQYVDFDPNNAEHLEAFRMLCVNTDDNGAFKFRQHPTLRFKFDRRFSNVREMMLVEVGRRYLDIVAQPAQ